jgi:universal stress protein A
MNTSPEPQPAAAPALHLKRLLVPVDFSPASRQALRYAQAFAQLSDAELVLLHVVGPAYTNPDFPAAPLAMPEIDEAAHHELEAMAAALPAFLKRRAEIREGNAPDQICAFAQSDGTDLIIVATHGRRGLGHLLLGSTAEAVVRRAPCPVLVVREREHEFVT